MACGRGGVAGVMGCWLGPVWGPGGGEEGVSMSIAGCYDRGIDACWNLQNFVCLSYCKYESTGQNSVLNYMGGGSGGGP